MNPIKHFATFDRRVLLSSLAMLPLFSASLRSTPAVAQTQRDPLPSWNEGATKASILDFVARVTTQGGPYFVPVEQRIATFDNDGTLWIEQPMYMQLAFALDRVKVMAPMHPEWKTKQPFAAVLDGDHEGAGGFRRKRIGRNHRRDACRHDHGGVREDRHRLARDRAGSPLQAALYRTGLPADAGTAGLSPRQRLQDLHRVRRRHRVHAAVDRADLRSAAGAGRRIVDQDPI